VLDKWTIYPTQLFKLKFIYLFIYFFSFVQNEKVLRPQLESVSARGCKCKTIVVKTTNTLLIKKLECFSNTVYVKIRYVQAFWDEEGVFNFKTIGGGVVVKSLEGGGIINEFQKWVGGVVREGDQYNLFW